MLSGVTWSRKGLNDDTVDNLLKSVLFFNFIHLPEQPKTLSFAMLDENCLREFPKSLSMFPLLTEIRLHMNDIKFIPQEIADSLPITLTSLNLSCNPFGVVPDFSKLTNLTEL